VAEKNTGSAVKPVSQLATAADLSRKLDQLRSGRMQDEKEWRLNIAFYRGKQYASWNDRAGRMEYLPTEDNEKPRYRVRIVSNQITSGVQSFVSKVTRSKPMFGATPGQPGDKALKAAQFSEDLLESWWHSLALSTKYREAVEWSAIASRGYWKLDWDRFANKAMRFLINPHTGQPITNEAEAAEFRAQLEIVSQEAGVPLSAEMFERVVYMGDVSVEVMSPFDVYLDPQAKTWTDAKWAICRHYLAPDEIKTRYGKDVKADAVPAAPDVSLPFYGTDKSTDPTVKAVYIGYFLPTPELPKGRYVVFIEDPDEILLDAPWPEPFPRMLPLVEFKGLSVPGGTESDAMVTHARPLQKQVNRLLSQITEYTNMVIKPRVWAPVNSLRQRLTTEPGAVYEYTPVGNFKPEIEQLPSIPPYVFEFLNNISGRLREVFGLTEVTEGQLPPNLEAADAIDLLQDMAIDRFAPTIQDNELALARAGQFLLELAQKFYVEPRMLKIPGFGGQVKVREFKNTDFSGDIVVRVEAGSSLPRSRAARRKQIERWIEMGLIDPRTAWKHYDIADVKDIAMKWAVDEEHALREHDKIIKGAPLNPEAVQSAMMAVNQGINPETGAPIDEANFEAEMQAVLERASLTPGIADNDMVHDEKHSDYVKSQEFEAHSPDVRRRFLMHLEMTKQRIAAAAPQPESQAPRVSLGLKGTVGPTAAAQILNKAGVQVDAETMATEPPLETWVTDSVDKPDADAAGPGQEANQLSQAAQAMLAVDVANAEAQQKARQSEEMHAHATRKAAADADLAEKKARESSFTPAPKAAPKEK
jgi:hypothetical protein